VPAGSTAVAECISRLRDDFARLDIRRTAAVLLEGVGGSGSGVLVPPPGYLEELRRLCDASGLPWICDEVMSGFGRTGRCEELAELLLRLRATLVSLRSLFPR
jgi:adenosylmethionine-8-amino-7-oxononanoate aminotransferase